MRHCASCSSRRSGGPQLREARHPGSGYSVSRKSAWAGVERPAAEATLRCSGADAPRRIPLSARANAPATGLPTPTLRRFPPARVNGSVQTTQGPSRSRQLHRPSLFAESRSPSGVESHRIGATRGVGRTGPRRRNGQLLRQDAACACRAGCVDPCGRPPGAGTAAPHCSLNQDWLRCGTPSNRQDLGGGCGVRHVGCTSRLIMRRIKINRRG